MEFVESQINGFAFYDLPDLNQAAVCNHIPNTDNNNNTYLNSLYEWLLGAGYAPRLFLIRACA
ncbi:hypothetical protein LRS76_10355 [Bacillus amyloliquefaciens]|uniref:hypothetical protein n=1 Tax=Bacillus amyloliquefaciens group TaxID=1938374 RepID=UPI001E616765|nr:MULTISPECIES: hypothetical protein [Bacillus amyloliquefaciens group]MCC8309925.1 hypothetical protein [Bacillus velezensis]MCC8312853.1 hypothetical protein [Bacillus velezensis]MCD5428130.1 hypothetical protein [Bacillus amyloliquefaciens]MCO7132573.1 hypothetical protein [Bacillus velezensis]MCO7141094.1 hypothetical protein [Bacillus velezensis]